MNREAAPCYHGGPGFATPMDAFRNGPREKLLYVPAIRPPGSDKLDYLTTVDVDPESSDYSKVIHRLPLGSPGEELHHSGWNVCSSCHEEGPGKARRYLILPAVFSGSVFVVDTADSRFPKLHKHIPGTEIAAATNSSFPHTTHCLATGEIMISTMGTAVGKAQGNFILLDESFNLKGSWANTKTLFGYDFWYQPRKDVMLSSAWGEPNAFKDGFNPSHLSEGKYGSQIYVWKWSTRELLQTIDLGEEGMIPLELRFYHNPDSEIAFVGAALSSAVFMIYPDPDGTTWKAKKVIQVEPKQVEGWALPSMPGLITDILISLDDKYLYFSNWLHGDIRQYDITDPHHPKLVGQVVVGGSLRKSGPVTFSPNEADPVYPSIPTIQGITPPGGPQMIQLSLDGKRLYVTTSLLGPWDKQFYPDLVKQGSVLLQIDVDTEKGGLRINDQFLVDFGKEPDGPVLAHECRYPGGDCSSDIWV